MLQSVRGFQNHSVGGTSGGRWAGGGGAPGITSRKRKLFPKGQSVRRGVCVGGSNC